MGTRTGTDAATRLTVPVSGMTCASCEKRVTTALLTVPGVESVRVSAARGSATVLAHGTPDRDRLEAAIRSAGYEPVAPAWLTGDRTVWRTVAVGAAVVAVLAALYATLSPGTLTAALLDPAQGGLLLVLVLGLTAGFSTCMVLVGGLVLGFSASHAAALAARGAAAPAFMTRMRPPLVFNAGRVVGFAVFGAALGALGSTMSLPARVTAVLALAVAAVMLLLGVRLTGISPRAAAWSPRLPAGLGRLLGLDTAAGRPYSHLRTALAGAATFALPCGFTQAVQVFALSSAAPLTAGAVMATFAVGTTPGLLALAAVPEVTTGARQTAVLRVVGVLVLGFAVLNVTSSLTLLGVGAGPSGQAAAAAAARTASSNVTVADGVQVVRMTQGADGYLPADTVLYAGLPTRWVIEGTARFSCSAALRVPDLGLKVDLVPGENTVQLPALDAGTVPFACVMGMYSGTLVAVDPPGDLRRPT